MARARIERRMERNEIGLAQQTVERRESEPRFALLLLRFATRGPIEHTRVKAGGTSCHRLADQSAAADQADGFAPDQRAKGPFGWRNTKSLTIIARMVTARCGSPESV